MMAASSRGRRLLKLGLAASAVIAAGAGSSYVTDSPWWSTLAPVRFGRAAIAVRPSLIATHNSKPLAFSLSTSRYW